MSACAECTKVITARPTTAKHTADEREHDHGGGAARAARAGRNTRAASTMIATPVSRATTSGADDPADHQCTGGQRRAAGALEHPAVAGLGHPLRHVDVGRHGGAVDRHRPGVEDAEGLPVVHQLVAATVDGRDDRHEQHGERDGEEHRGRRCATAPTARARTCSATRADHGGRRVRRAAASATRRRARARLAARRRSGREASRSRSRRSCTVATTAPASPQSAMTARWSSSKPDPSR